MTKTLDTAELIQKMTDAMATWEGESIAEKANGILTEKVTYLGDDLYEVEDAD